MWAQDRAKNDRTGDKVPGSNSVSTRVQIPEYEHPSAEKGAGRTGQGRGGDGDGRHGVSGSRGPDGRAALQG